jgi:putative membrane protein
MSQMLRCYSFKASPHRFVERFVQWQRSLYRAAVAAGAVVLLVLILELLQWVRWCFELHEPIGITVTAVIVSLGLRDGGKAFRGYWRLPVVTPPPPLPREPTVSDLRRRARYVHRYLGQLGSNPFFREVGGDLEQLKQVMGQMERLMAREMVGKGRAKASAELVSRWASVEQETQAVLRPLDEAAARLIRERALQVGLATMLSPNGVVDAFLVVWWQVSLVSTITELYYARPGLAGSCRILMDVAAAMVLSWGAEEASETLGEVVESLTANSTAFLVGAARDGLFNALTTLRVGFLARNRCKAFEAWVTETSDLGHELRGPRRRSSQEAREQSRELLAALAKEGTGKILLVSRKLVTDLASFLADKVWDNLKKGASWWKGWST